MSYSETDLVHNRRGDLSPAQQARLTAGWRRWRILAIGFALIVLGLGAILTLLGEPTALIGTGMFAGFIALGVIGVERKVRQVLAAGSVAMIVGQVQRFIENDGGTKRYILYVDGTPLLLDGLDDYDQFEDGARFRVYYVSRTGYVVSAEPDA